MVRRLGLGGAALGFAMGCGARTIDYGDYGDWLAVGSGGAAGDGSAKGGGRSKGAAGAVGTGAAGPIPGGGASMGGRAGDAGAGAGGVTPSCAPQQPPSRFPLLIDDMEDGDVSLPPNDGRSGTWYAFNDMRGMQRGPVAMSLFPPRQGSKYAVFTAGSGFSSWGAGIGVVLRSGCSFDASDHIGITFFARASNAVDVPIRFGVNTVAVTPLASGGSCLADCWDSHGYETVVNDAWGFYQIPFYLLAQQGFGAPVSFNPAQLISVQFQVGPDQEFELWIDDVSFY